MRKIKFNLKKALAALLALSCAAVGTLCIIKAAGDIKYHLTLSDSKIIDSSLVTLIGDGGCGENVAPDTVSAIDGLIYDGFTRIKIDVRLSENKEWICIKEEDISSVTDGSGSISSMTYYEALKYNINIGESNETLRTAEQLVEYSCTNGIYPIILIHDYDEEAISRLIAFLEENAFIDQTVIASYSARTLKYAKSVNNFIQCELFADKITDKVISLCRNKNYALCFNAKDRENTREAISKLDSYQMEYSCFNADDLRTVERYYNYGVRQFITNIVKP